MRLKIVVDIEIKSEYLNKKLLTLTMSGAVRNVHFTSNFECNRDFLKGMRN